MTERIQPWVSDLILKHGGMYTTPNDYVELIIQEDESFTFTCSWPAADLPGRPTIHLELGRTFDDYFEFEYVFPILELSDLDNLTPEGLFKLYGSGDIWIFGNVDENPTFEFLGFKLENGATQIWDASDDQIIPYSGDPLVTPEQITFFIRNYIKDKYPLLEGTAAGPIGSKSP